MLTGTGSAALMTRTLGCRNTGGARSPDELPGLLARLLPDCFHDHPHLGAVDSWLTGRVQRFNIA